MQQLEMTTWNNQRFMVLYEVLRSLKPNHDSLVAKSSVTKVKSEILIPHVIKKAPKSAQFKKHY